MIIDQFSSCAVEICSISVFIEEDKSYFFKHPPFRQLVLSDQGISYRNLITVNQARCKRRYPAGNSIASCLFCNNSNKTRARWVPLNAASNIALYPAKGPCSTVTKSPCRIAGEADISDSELTSCF